MSSNNDLIQTLAAQYTGVEVSDLGDRLRLQTPADNIPGLVVDLSASHGYEFASLVVEDGTEQEFTARYFFYTDNGAGSLIEITTRVAQAELPAISDEVHAADWHEREAEDMFGIHFSGHPFLGDFMLHDTTWPENVAPMRAGFDPRQRPQGKGLGEDWRPRRLLEEEGALAFPVGPVWGDYAESGLWLLETPGEQIRQAHSRLFYKYRGVEKIAEGQEADQVLLLAERFSGSSAFAHALAYCQALETLSGCKVPPRAQALRMVLAEFERMRYHAATLAELAGSTGLVVAKARGQEIEESLLRLAGEVFGHRYLFGLVAPGGFAWVPDDSALDHLDHGVQTARAQLKEFEHLLVNSSSFLDRLEEMGTLTPEHAALYGAVGPVGRASGRKLDLRRTLPYAGYDPSRLTLAEETEGDGYARLRVYFTEIGVSAALIHEQLSQLPRGAIAKTLAVSSGAALAWVEAPAGAAFHWVHIGENGCIARWHVSSPSFRNWHAFHRAVEGGAFQDFPIILASFGLSAAENDR